MPFAPISPENPLILASGSPRRKALLRQLGLPYRARKSRVLERLPEGPPESVARRLAEQKASRVGAAFEKAWVLGADTLVITDRILGKPDGTADACRMLRLLSGREHQVITGFCLLDPHRSPCHSEAVSTRVRFKPLREAEIEAYVATGEPFGKAGGYAIQGIGAFLVESITGSYTNVVGLPLCALVKALQTAGAVAGFPLPAGESPRG